MDLKITPSGQTIVKPTALGPVANTDTKLLIYGLFQKGRVLAQDGVMTIETARRASLEFVCVFGQDGLDEHLELFRCYYNFVRSHGALKFGREIRTPAMQAGLTTRRLTFRDIFLATTIPLWSRIEVFLLSWARNPLSSAPVPLPAAA